MQHLQHNMDYYDVSSDSNNKAQFQDGLYRFRPFNYANFYCFKEIKMAIMFNIKLRLDLEG
jgi:hypothetical protein